jgi:peptidyl-prolyl cis-trans isomerase SurA
MVCPNQVREPMSLKRPLLCLLTLATFVAGPIAWPTAVPAQDSVRIAAVVNDDAISMLDVYERMQIIVVTANLEDNQETRQRLLPQVLRTLIDERLQLQEGERQGVEVTDAEIESATGYIEDSIGIQRGQLGAFLDYNHVSRDSFMAQVTIELTWNKLVRQRMRPENITDEEITVTLERLKANANQPAYRLAEIFISIDDPSRENEVRANMERLADSIRGGASFPAIARQFSQSASSATGGDLDWILESQLPDDIRDVVASLPPGTMSDPIRVIGGYKLILVRDKRIGFASSDEEPELIIRQVLLPVGPEDDEVAIQAQADAIVDTLASCDDFDAVNAMGSELQVSAPITARLSELQPMMVDVVKNLEVGEPSAPVRSELGYHVVMVCERKAVDGGLPSRQDIYKQLDDEQFDLVSRGYLRDLRRSAFVDIRL